MYLDKEPALIILNQPIDFDIDALWNSAKTRICADGGYDRLMDYNTRYQTNHLPDIVIGDLDSLTNSECRFIKISDQNSTDFEKCLNYINVANVIVVGALGGRLDHTLANIQTIVKSPKNVVLVDKVNTAFRLKNGLNTINCKSGLKCGLIPFRKTNIVTTGLEYNLDGEYEFGEFISTSNQTLSERITVQVDSESVLWTQEK